jgi:hypothetical protein
LEATLKYSKEQKYAMTEVLREAITVLSPKELILVDRCLDVRDDGSSMLGFDGGATVQLLLPYLLNFVKEMASSTVGELGKKYGKDLSNQLLKRPSRDDKLEVRHLNELGKDFEQRLSREGISPQEASRIADTMIATLVSHPGRLRKIVGLPA